MATQGISEDEEKTLLAEGEENPDSRKQDIASDSLTTTLANLNQTMAAMAGNISSMGNTLKRMQTDSAASLKAKKRKEAFNRDVELSNSDASEEESDSDDSAKLLQASRTQQRTAQTSQENRQKNPNEDPSTSFLGTITQDYDSEEKTTDAVSEKLAEFVNKRFSAKLGDTKLKDKLDKYARPSNCGKLIVPTVNPEIWDKLDHLARRRDLRVASTQKTVTKVGAILTSSVSKIMTAIADPNTLNLEELLTLNTDAIALLGHDNLSLSQHRRDLIRPCLNKDYSTLCAPHIPITEKLFGDELQSQLSSIKASNRISNLAAGGSNRRHDKSGNNNRGRRSFLGQKGRKNPHFNNQKKHWEKKTPSQ